MASPDPQAGSGETKTKYLNLTGLSYFKDKIMTLINAKGTYSKPSGGIPKTDLASTVQTSLEKADSALQSVTSNDIATALGYTPISQNQLNTDILNSAKFITYSTPLTTSDSAEDIISDVFSQVTVTTRIYLINVLFAAGGSSFMVIARKASTTIGAALAIGHGVPFLGLKYVRLNNGVLTITDITNVETGTITPATGVTMNSASYLRKNGKVIDLYYVIQGASIAADTSTVIGTLPTGFRPGKVFVCDTKFNFGFSSSGGEQHEALVQISTDGSIRFLSHDALATSHTVRIKTSYIIN